MDVLIVGAGPAGISASLYTQRAGLDTLVVYKDRGVLEKAERIENFYGLPAPVSGKELAANGIEGARRLGVQLARAEVVDLQYDGELLVGTTAGEYRARAVLLATGAARATLPVPGLRVFEGKGVSFCATCDAYFYRGKDVAVIGEGEHALHEAQVLAGVARSVTILTNAKAPTVEFPASFEIIPEKLSAARGEERVAEVVFKGGRVISVDGIFMAVGVAGSIALAAKVGAFTQDGRILTDENRMTNVPGLFAAGDCTGGLLQVSKAVCDGAIAGTAMAEYCRNGGGNNQ